MTPNVMRDLLLPSKGTLNFKNKNTALIFELAPDGITTKGRVT